MGTKQSDDLGWLHTAINEQATGCSPLICDRIRIFYAMLDDGRLTCAALAKKNKPLSLGQCQTALTAGGQLDIFKQHRQPNGRGGGCLPSLWSRNPDGLAQLAGAGRPADDVLFQCLNEEQRELLETYDWRKRRWRKKSLQITSWLGVARLIAWIRDSRRATYGDVARALGVSKGWVEKYVGLGRHLKLLEVENPHDRWSPDSRSTFRVVWSKFKSLRPGPRTSLEVPNRGKRISNRSAAGNRTDDARNELVGRIDKQMLGCEYQSEVVVIRKLLSAVGTMRVASRFDLATELSVSPATVSKGIAAGKKAGILASRPVWDDENGKKSSELTVLWDRVAVMAGEQVPSQPSTNDHAKPAARKRARRGRGRPGKWDHLKSCLRKYLREDPAAEPKALRARYRTEHPSHPLPRPNSSTLRVYVATFKAEAAAL